MFKAHRLVYHSTLGWRVIKKKEPPMQRRRGRAVTGGVQWRDLRVY